MALMEQVHVEQQKVYHMTVYAATYMYVSRSSLCSCYSRPLRSYIPPCTIVDTCVRYLHGYCYEAKRSHREQSFRVALFNPMCGHTHMRTVAFSIKANYLKMVTVRTLYRDSMPLTISNITCSLSLKILLTASYLRFGTCIMLMINN